MALICAIFTGCAVGPNYRRPEAKVSPGFGEITVGNSNITSRATSNSPAVEWWHSFKDAELDHLIDEALKQNYNLRIAMARVREARYQRSIVAADLLPNVDADSGYWHGRGSKNVTLPLGGGGAGAGGKSSASPKTRSDPPGGGISGSSAGSDQLTPFGKGGLPGVTSSLYQIGFDSNWELDVFGGTRRRLEAAADDLAASVEGLHDITITLLAEVARNYIELRGTQQRLKVARENLAAQQETLELTVSRANAGLTSRADVTRAAAQLATTSATVPPLQASVRQSIHLLSTLVAQEPTALSAELETNQPLVFLPPEVPVGLPSELLKRRPDIRRAERQMAAATARIGSAEADLFPKFALTGGVGLDSTSTGSLFDWQSRYFFISPTVTWRVFDAGRIISNVALQKAARQESLWQYRNTTLTALREVEDGLVAYATEQERRNALAEALKQNQDSLGLIRNQYQNGLATFLEVLDAQRNVLFAQDELAQADQTLGTDLVTLYKALGGGWETRK
ncbi:MAG TPA: efflux transporter outer membrane subunit [Verrucomicrobiae bacterium]|jgi:NodT family efflux transporter outer membrane factor (OMF) lipoprotein|nr:efflux transporter outer membrane subunit [Verrucomicrobiae bacterium]